MSEEAEDTPVKGGPHEVFSATLTAAALGRLFKNDYDLQINIGRQVVEVCAKKYLHNILTETAFEEYAKAEAAGLREFILKEIGERFYDYNKGRYQSRIRDELLTMMRDTAKDLVGQVIGEVYDTVIAENEKKLADNLAHYESRNRRMIDEKLTKLYSDLELNVQTRVDAQIAQRIRESAEGLLAKAIQAAKSEPLPT